MNTLKLKFISALSSLVLLLSISTYVSAADLNLPGFSGTVNTTITSGVSMRVERNCLSVRGSKYLPSDDGDYTAHINADSGISASDKSVFLTDGEGCAKRYTDGYGNTGASTSGARSLISENADNGRTNFDGGDIFDVTQRVFSEIVGSTDDGTSVNLSFVGTYNPVVDVNGNPEFAPFTSEQQDDIESDLTLLNAYVSKDLNMDHTITVGRFVTSWGESTFIPIGMNGLTTNAVDLSKLRNPGSSIKEALIPTEQLTLSGFLSDGWSYEAYMQFNEAHVELDEAGQFFGSDAAAGDRLIISGQFSGNDQARSAACGYLNLTAVGSGGAGKTCTAASALAYYNGDAAAKQKTDMYLYDTGIKAFVVGTDNRTGTSASNTALFLGKTATLGAGAATGWGGVGGEINTLGGSAASSVLSALTTNWDIFERKQGRKAGTVDLSGGNHIFADGEEQYGVSLRKFLPDFGTGVDLGFHFTQYDSKVPYLRLKGQQGLIAGDLLGLFTLAAATNTNAGPVQFLSRYLSAGVAGAELALSDTQLQGKGLIQLGLANVAFSEAGCGAYTQAAAANAVFGDGLTHVYTAEEKVLAQQAEYYTAINGKLYHDAGKCATQAAGWGTATTQGAAAALLGAAVTPLNAAEYEFIYPENLQAFGISANTNIGDTAVQLEITYRPDFPLATDGGEQGQQLSDAGGTTTLLAQAVAKGIYDADVLAENDAKKTATVAQYNATHAGTTDWAGVLMAIKDFKRSNLPAISLATVSAGDYYTTPFFEHDVISGTLGTTSAFSASHPLTVALGADSTVLLSEFGFVSVDGLSMDRPVARGGYRDGVGGDKCGGVTKGGTLGATGFRFAGASVSATHLGSAQTDPLFGNGAYCEAKNNADDFAMTYRLIGSASYNNIANSPWSLSNSVVWSHDFDGYSPSSMGGFVPGKRSLSLASTLTKGDVKASVSYVNQMGDEMDNLGFDMDYVSASVSYAF
jgi:hypothetical protein